MFTSAQQEVEKRGGSFQISGLMLFTAAKAGDDFSALLLDAMGFDIERLAAAVDAEWSARSRYMQDGAIGRESAANVVRGLPCDYR